PQVKMLDGGKVKGSPRLDKVKVHDCKKAAEWVTGGRKVRPAQLYIKLDAQFAHGVALTMNSLALALLEQLESTMRVIDEVYVRVGGSAGVDIGLIRDDM
ncbi:hypothetical protein HAX54_040584, partial [Datura stramonium]|nr:hypothetical protein [Datura stramonium]